VNDRPVCGVTVAVGADAAVSVATDAAVSVSVAPRATIVTAALLGTGNRGAGACTEPTSGNRSVAQSDAAQSARVGNRWRRSELPKLAQFGRRDAAIGYEIRDQQRRRAAERGAKERGQRPALHRLAPDARVKAVRPSFGYGAQVALGDHSAHEREDGRVGEVLGEPLAHLGDGPAAELPEDGDDLEFAGRERDGHGAVAACAVN
jgi:hypothetical protein